jgi:hypothetical protein
MMAADVSMDFDVVTTMADVFQATSESLDEVDQALEMAIAVLKASAFIGLVGNLALAAYLDNIRPHVGRLAATCQEMSGDLRGAIVALRDGDYSGSLRFIDGGGSGRSGAPTAPGQPAAGGGKVVNYLSMYQDGVNGWQLIPIGDKFTSGELLTQIGPACTIYGVMNLLVENGYDISQADADKHYNNLLRLPNPESWMGMGLWDSIRIDMLDGSHDYAGFDVSRADEILITRGVDYDHDDFSTWGGLGSPERGDAEKFLVKQLNAGNPVYVTTEVNEAFGMGSGAHAYTVIGAQTDSNGKLTNVLVATNWKQNGPVWEIPARDFMDDWMEYNDGEYIVLEH